MALGAAKAIIVPQHEFGLLNGQGDMECPSEGTQYDVYRLPERRIRDRPNRYWAVGIRLGPPALGNIHRERPERPTFIRELMGFLQARGNSDTLRRCALMHASGILVWVTGAPRSP